MIMSFLMNKGEKFLGKAAPSAIYEKHEIGSSKKKLKKAILMNFSPGCSGNPF